MAASDSVGSGGTTNPPLGAAGQSCATRAAGSCCGTPAAKGDHPGAPPVLCAGLRAAGVALRTLAPAGSLSQPTPHGARSRALCGRALCPSTREAPEPRAQSRHCTHLGQPALHASCQGSLLLWGPSPPAGLCHHALLPSQGTAEQTLRPSAVQAVMWRFPKRLPAPHTATATPHSSSSHHSSPTPGTQPPAL